MKNLQFLAIALGVCTLFSCDKESDATMESSTVSGAAVKGYVGSARVDIYEYSANGERGTLVASTATDAKGSFSVETSYRGPAEIVVTQGSYSDEATGTSVALENRELRSVVTLDKENRVAAVTALTTIAAQHVDAHAAAGIETAIANANREVAAAFGLTGIDIAKDIPADLSQAATGKAMAQVKYGAVQAGLSQAIKESNISAEQLLTLVQDMSEDFSDGVFDGRSGGAALEYSQALTPEQAMTGLNTAIENFMNSSRNRSGHTAGSAGVSVPAPGGR